MKIGALECFKNLINSEKIKLYSCEDLSNLLILKHLSLIDCSVNLGVEPFKNLKNLISLKTNLILNDETIKHLINLKELILTEYSLTGKCFMYLTQLVELDLEYCVFDEDIIFDENYLKYLVYLEILFLTNIQIKGEFLQYLKKLKNLYFFPNYEFKDNYLKDLLNLKYSTVKIEDSNFNEFTGECLLNLVNLNIQNSIIKDEYLNHLQNLQHLNITNCKCIEGKCLLNKKFKKIGNGKYNDTKRRIFE
ncbi:hypothetical protein ABK040_004242 [Willaertia magna]